MEQQDNTQDILFQGSYTMTYEEAKDFYLFTSKRCYWWLKVLKWLVVSFLSYNLFGAILISIILDITDFKQLTPVFVILIIIFFLVFIIPSTLKKQQIKNMLNNIFVKDSHVNYYFYQDKFVYNTEQTSTTVFYNQLYDIHETSQCFLLYITKNTGYIVPKRSFTGYTNEELREFVKNKVGTKFSLHSK